MRNRTHGGYKVLLDELWEFCEEFNAYMVMLWEHMACKALSGFQGQFEEMARERGIHLVWVTHDLFDPRVVLRQGVRDQVNNYMRTVMGEEPIDPTLEVLPDEKSYSILTSQSLQDNSYFAIEMGFAKCYNQSASVGLVYRYYSGFPSR